MPFVRGTRLRGVAVSALAFAALGVAGCSSVTHPLGGGSGPKAVSNPESAAQIGVNGYLWRATLDTLSFMPLQSADPYGGVIITDWYTNPKAPGERVKLTVAVLDPDLRADALRVSAARQIQSNGGWVDAPVSAATVQKLEDIILTRARDLRRVAVSG